MGDTQRSYDETEDFVKHINTKKTVSISSYMEETIPSSA